MNIGYLLPGFSAHENDWAIPIQQELVSLLAQRHTMRVIALRYPHTDIPYILGNAHVYPLGAGQARGISRLQLWRQARTLIRALHRRAPFDLLHATWADETGMLAVWLGRELGIPSVVTIAGGELVGFRDLDYGLQRSAFSRWIVRQALKADRLIPISRYQRRLLKDIDEARIRVIPFGINTQHFYPDSSPHYPDRLLHTASLVPIKDQITLLKAFARLPPSLQLDIIGAGPQESLLRDLSRQLGVRERVCFMGAIDYPQLPIFYRRAALHILPSRHEAQGMVTLEAAACGAATAGTAVGLLADDTALGMAVPAADDVGLAGIIEQMLSRSEAYGERALQRARSTYRLDQTIEQLEAVYRELV